MTSLISSLVQALDFDARSSLVHSLRDKITTVKFESEQTPQAIDALAETVDLLDDNNLRVCRDV